VDVERLTDASRLRSRATVLHADADSFFAAVEQRDKPSLRGKPVLVGGTGPRGVVSTASYEARRAGAHSAMSMSRARRLVPAAAVLYPRFGAYSAASQLIMAELAGLSELIEQVSIDEAYVDLDAGPYGDDPERAAADVRARIRERTGLAVSIGLGRTKLIAKLASDAGKPDGLLLVEPQDEDEFLLPLSARAVPGIGPATMAALERLDVRTVADLRRQPLDVLTMTIGESAGTNLFRLARGFDPRPVAPGGERKSVGAERTFGADIFGTDAITSAVEAVADEALRRLTAHGGGARTVVAKVRFTDFTTVTRSVTLPQPSADPIELRAAAQQAARAAGITDAVRLLGVSFHNLSAHAQLTFPWDDEPDHLVVDEPEAQPDDQPAEQSLDTARTPQFGRLLDEHNARPGLDVEHAERGLGWVVHVRGRTATVRFETAGSAPARSQVLDLDADPLVLAAPWERV